MPFDPAQPANNSPLSSQVMRNQLVALLQLIQSIPAGPQGPPGNDGPPFAQAIIDAVNTLNPGDAATVTVSFDGTNVHLTFGIPRGFDGTNGSNGSDGEVSNATLASAISGTSNNTNAVPTLDTPFADPDMETLRAAYNALVQAARR